MVPQLPKASVVLATVQTVSDIKIISLLLQKGQTLTCVVKLHMSEHVISCRSSLILL